MIIGPLRERITLQSQTTTQSSTGAMTKVWADVATVWAQIKPVLAGKGSREFFEAGKNQSEVKTLIYIRYSSDVSAVDNTHRVKFGTRYYDILVVTNHQERNRLISLACSEGARDDE